VTQVKTRPQTASQRLASFGCSLAYEDLPAEVVSAAKLHILDAIGCGLAAYGVGAAESIRAVAVAAGEGRATVIGETAGISAPAAALANGGLIHALDFDDTHTPSISHISTVVVPAALATAESVSRTGCELIAAVVAGSEAVARIGAAAAPAYMKTGFHPTSACLRSNPRRRTITRSG
jgi:2-methylcitrate dehydratase PrpD